MQRHAISQSTRSHLRQLFTAINNQNVKGIRTFISQLGGYVNDKIPNDEDGRTPLHLVAQLGSIEILKLFAEANYVDLNAEDNRGYTALHYVIESQNLEAAKILIEAGADIGKPNIYFKTPLHLLIEKQVNSKIIEFLINIKNKEGENSLFAAVKLGNIEITKLLIDHGCDVNCMDYFGSTILHQLAKSSIGENDHFEIAKVLLKTGLDVNVKDNLENTVLHFLVEKACNIKMIEFFLDFKANVNVKNIKGEIPLFNAVIAGNLEAIQLLIYHRSDVNSVNINGSTVLHKAASFNKDNSHFIVELLLKNGAYLNVKDKNSNTPLHLLAYHAKVETVESFLNSGANVHVKDSEGETPLFNAVRGGNDKVVQLLLDHGSDVNCINNLKFTPLHLAANLALQSNDNLRTFEVLLKNGANVNARNNDGRTTLHCLVNNKNNIEIVKLLLNYKPKVNIEDNKGEIALLYAIKNNDVNIMQLLFDHGSNVNCIMNYRQTPLHLKFAYYDNISLKVVKCLLKNGADANALDFMGRTPLFTQLLNRFMYTNSFEKKLKFMLRHSDINIIDLNGENLLSYCTNGRDWNLILEHMAILQALNISINPDIVNYISDRSKYNDYLSFCLKELTLAKSTKIKDCWITFFNLLVDNRRRLKNYGGNTNLIEEFKKSEFTKKFPIYGSTMQENLEKGIKRRELFDESAEVLSNKWPIFGPSHLVIRDILDCCLSTKDLSKFCE